MTEPILEDIVTITGNESDMVNYVIENWPIGEVISVASQISDDNLYMSVMFKAGDAVHSVESVFEVASVETPAKFHVLVDTLSRKVTQ